MSIYEDFKVECLTEIRAQGANPDLAKSTTDWTNQAILGKYAYHFEWLGRPIIQYPQDIVAMQELIWSVQPELIIETGIAHGGSLIFSAAMLELNAVCGGPSDAKVVGIDIDIRSHNRTAIEAHPMSKRISMIQGSSIASDVIDQVKTAAAGKRRILVCLDSNHTHDHVLAELRAFGPLVTRGSYCVVFDTIIENLSPAAIGDRPWSPGNSPMSAVQAYLKETDRFEIDHVIENKLLITVAPHGYLKCVKE